MTFFKKFFLLKISFIFIIILFLMIMVAYQPPESFPKKVLSVEIEKGRGISFATDTLYKKGLIKSPFVFKIFAMILSLNKGVHAGEYRFTEAQNSWKIAYRMVYGETDQPKVSVTIPPGTNVSDMAFIFLKALPDFNAPRFVSLANGHEGYLYPDTYLFFANVKSEEIIKVMKDNFDKKIALFDSEIKNSGHSLKEIIIMASIIEKEIRGDDMAIVSGILWKRMKVGMMLQVDAPFYYLTGRTDGVKLDDTKIDSLYNTYKYKGLPKGPITNPGIKSIIAALRPVESKYFFYLSAKDKSTKYGVTFDDHLLNKEKYLK